MPENRYLSSEARARLTGLRSSPGFDRSCYIVRNHGDGTGTIALDWYEMSNGRDYMTSEIFMRTEINVALQIVKLLNSQLPLRVHAAEQVDWPDSD